nr:hypothetical protein [Candidatus Enterousia merdequi]
MQDITASYISELVTKHNAYVHALWQIWDFNGTFRPEHLKVKHEPFGKLFDKLYSSRHNIKSDYIDTKSNFLLTVKQTFDEYEQFEQDTLKEIRRLKTKYLKDYIIALINLTNQVETISKQEKLTVFQQDGLQKLSTFCNRCKQNIDPKQKYILTQISDIKIDEWVQEIRKNPETRFDIKTLAERIKWFCSMQQHIQENNKQKITFISRQQRNR